MIHSKLGIIRSHHYVGTQELGQIDTNLKSRQWIRSMNYEYTKSKE